MYYDLLDMDTSPFIESPFVKFLPVGWQISPGAPRVFSLTRTHGLETGFYLHNLTGPVNRNREEMDKVLVSYEVAGNRYDLFTLADFHTVPYSFDEVGASNMRGDLAERVARRIMKRFLKCFDRRRGKIGGLFDERFDPKNRENYVVTHSSEYVLKIGSYPNMILLKKAGPAAWDYHHVTDLDGLFDYRYLSKRHLIILESKVGKIDLNAGTLYQTLFKPLMALFPEAYFSYVLFAAKEHLLDGKNPEYRILQEGPKRIFQELSKQNVPCFFFEFNENEAEFSRMCKHLITSYRSYHNQTVSFQGNIEVSDESVTIRNPGTISPYLELRLDKQSGQFRVVKSARRFDPLGSPMPPETD